MSPGIRMAAVLVYLGVPLVAAAATAFNLVRGAEIAAAAEARGGELALLEARLGREPAAAGDELVSVWLPGETRALAAAGLQERLAALLDEVQARVIEVQELEVEEGPDVLMRVTFDATNAALIASLIGVEGALPLIEVTGLDVSAQRAGENGRGDDPTLRVSLTVRGFRKAGS